MFTKKFIRVHCHSLYDIYMQRSQSENQPDEGQSNSETQSQSEEQVVIETPEPHQGLSDTPTGAVPVPAGIMWKFINIIFL